MENKILVILVTVPSREVASKISQKLILDKLAACVNIIPHVSSVFSWKGELEHCSETLLLIKTAASRFAAVEKEILKLHPYETPEILALSAAEVTEAYAKWVMTETT